MISAEDARIGTGTRIRTSSTEAEVLVFLTQQSRLQDRGDAARKRGADGVERLVDAACEGAHAGGRTEGDESNNERVLNQILTFLTAGQILELDEELEKQVIHL